MADTVQILKFIAGKYLAAPGDTILLEWNAKGAGYCIMTPGDYRYQGETGRAAVSLYESMKFTLTAVNGQQREIRSLFIQVEEPEIRSFSIKEPGPFGPDENITLLFDVTVADHVYLNHGIGKIENTGSYVAKVKTNQKFILSCEGSGPILSRELEIPVRQAGIALHAPGNIRYGDTAKIEWEVKDAWEALYQNTGDIIPLNGSITVTPTGYSNLYRFQADGLPGRTEQAVEIIVTDAIHVKQYEYRCYSSPPVMGAREAMNCCGGWNNTYILVWDVDNIESVGDEPAIRLMLQDTDIAHGNKSGKYTLNSGNWRSPSAMTCNGAKGQKLTIKKQSPW